MLIKNDSCSYSMVLYAILSKGYNYGLHHMICGMFYNYPIPRTWSTSNTEVFVIIMMGFAVEVSSTPCLCNCSVLTMTS